jgi:hypothetical protein
MFISARVISIKLSLLHGCYVFIRIFVKYDLCNRVLSLLIMPKLHYCWNENCRNYCCLKRKCPKTDVINTWFAESLHNHLLCWYFESDISDIYNLDFFKSWPDGLYRHWKHWQPYRSIVKTCQNPNRSGQPNPLKT